MFSRAGGREHSANALRVAGIALRARDSVVPRLTWPALTGASNTYVLVTGSNKAQALRHVVSDAPDEHLYPAARIRLAEGAVIWWVDKEAAGGRLP